MDDAVSILARHGRSFRLAGRLLPRATLNGAAELYAFCRAVDDLADEHGDPAAARTSLLEVRAALLSGNVAHPIAARFIMLQQARGASLPAAVALVDTVLTDSGPVRVPDEAALLRYAYGVAGTVGLLMCSVLGTDDPQAAARAIDLGIAMQLTNIARDVMEDAGRDRIYLPASWLPPGMAPAELGSAPDAVFAAVRRVLARADRHYRSAELGYRYLAPRVRPAIRTAGRLYEEIGLHILYTGPDYLAAGRMVVPPGRKLLLVAGSLSSLLAGGAHDPALHDALRGLPGTPA